MSFPIHDIAAALRETADKVEDLYGRFMMPLQEMTIPEAFAKLRAAVGPDSYVSITPPSLHWHRQNDPIKGGDWSIWDGTTKDTYEGATLTAAVSAFMAAYAKPDPNPVDKVAELLAAVQPVPF